MKPGTSACNVSRPCWIWMRACMALGLVSIESVWGLCICSQTKITLLHILCTQEKPFGSAYHTKALLGPVSWAQGCWTCGIHRGFVSWAAASADCLQTSVSSGLGWTLCSGPAGSTWPATTSVGWTSAASAPAAASPWGWMTPCRDLTIQTHHRVHLRKKITAGDYLVPCVWACWLGMSLCWIVITFFNNNLNILLSLLLYIIFKCLQNWKVEFILNVW